jgi:hypothetical protein
MRVADDAGSICQALPNGGYCAGASDGGMRCVVTQLAPRLIRDIYGGRA